MGRKGGGREGLVEKGKGRGVKERGRGKGSGRVEREWVKGSGI